MNDQPEAAFRTVLKHVEEQLELSEARFRATFEHAAVGLAHVAPDGQWLLVNQRLCEIVGYTREELISLTFQAITHPADLAADLELLQQVLVGEIADYSLPKRYLRKDGSIVWVNLTVSLVRDEAGTPQYFISAVEDISEYKQAEAAQRASELRMRLATEATGVGIWQWNVNTNRVRWDAQMFKIYGLAPTADGLVDYDTWRAAVLPEDFPQQAELLQDTLRRRGQGARAFRIRRFDNGQCRHLQSVEVVQTDAWGAPEWVIGTNLDVTERLQAEARLRTSEAQLRAIYDGTHEYIGLLAPDGTVLEANRAALAFGDTQRADVVGQPFWKMAWFQFTPGASALVEQAVARAAAGEFVRFEAPILNPLGEQMVFDIAFQPIRNEKDEIVLLVPEGLDITERKRAEEALHARNAQLDLLARISQQLIVSERPEAELLQTVFTEVATAIDVEMFFNFMVGEQPDTLRLFTSSGLTPAQKEYFATIHFGEYLCGLVAQQGERLIAENLQSSPYQEAEMLRRGGVKCYAGFPLNAQGQFIGTIAFATRQREHFREGELQLVQTVCDLVAITLERTRAQKALRESERRLLMALEAAHAGVWESVPATGEFTASAQARSLHGLAADAPLSHAEALAVIHPEDQPRIEAALEQTLATGTPYHLELRVPQPDGSLRWLASHAELRSESAPPRLVGLVQDITARKRRELHLALLAELQKDFSSHSTVTQLVEATGARIAAHLNLSHCLFVEINETEDVADVFHDTHVPGVPSLVGFYERGNFYTEEERQRLAAGQTVAINNVRQASRSVATAERFEALGVQALCTAPYVNSGRWKFVLCVQHSQPYQWPADEIELLNELAERLYLRLERVRATELMRLSEENYRTLFNSIDEGYCIIEMLFDDANQPTDYRFLQINPAFARLTGLVNALGKRVRELVPDLEDFWFEVYGQVALTGVAVRFENHSEPMNRWFDVYAARIGDDTSRLVALIFNNITERKLAEAALRKNEERLTLALNSADMGVWTWDLQSNGIHWSPENYEIFGLTSFDGTLEAFAQTLYPEDTERVFATISACLTNCLPYEAEFRIQRGDGCVRWVASRGRTEYDAAGRPLRILSVVMDIEERKQAEAALHATERQLRAALATVEREQRRLQVILASLPVGVMVTDATGGVLMLNETLNDIWGGTRPLDSLHKYAQYQAWDLATHQLFKPEDWPITKALLSGEPQTGAEFGFKRFDDTTGVMSVVAVPVKDEQGAIIGGVAVAQDVTERRAAEVERERLLTQAHAARKAAEAATRAKDEFLALISHELRNPLNSILGYARLSRSNPQNAEAVVRNCEIIERSAKLQQQLIDDILDTARIVSGKLRIENAPTDLRLVLEDALTVVRAAIDAKQLTLITHFTEQPQYVMGDAARLQQVVWNLLQNAVKFTPQGGGITLRVTQSGQVVRIIVSDTGKGIEPQFLPTVFDRFSQNDMSRTRRYGGLGLGLALAKQLVELHGGTIEAASAGVNQGATFTITLPLLATPSARRTTSVRAVADLDAAAAPPLERVPRLDGWRVLVVDDEEDARWLMVSALTDWGAQVTTAASALEAETFLQQLKFTVLICDIAMPETDGFELVRRLRARERAQGLSQAERLPAIALSAMDQTKNRIQAVSAGFQLFLAKPVELAELIMVIASLGGQPRRFDGETYRS